MIYVAAPRFKTARANELRSKRLMCVIVWPHLTGDDIENWKVYTRWGGPYSNSNDETFRLCGQFETKGINFINDFYNKMSICVSRFTVDFGRIDLKSIHFNPMYDQEGISNQIALVRQVKNGLVKDISSYQVGLFVLWKVNSDKREPLMGCTVDSDNVQYAEKMDKQIRDITNVNGMSRITGAVDRGCEQFDSAPSLTTSPSMPLVRGGPTPSKRLKTSVATFKSMPYPPPPMLIDSTHQPRKLNTKQVLLQRIMALQAQLWESETQRGFGSCPGFGFQPGLGCVPMQHAMYSAGGVMTCNADYHHFAVPGPMHAPVYFRSQPNPPQQYANHFMPPVSPPVDSPLLHNPAMPVDFALKECAPSSGVSAPVLTPPGEGGADEQFWEGDYSPEISPRVGSSEYFSEDDWDLTAPGLTGGTTSVGAVPIDRARTEPGQVDGPYAGAAATTAEESDWDEALSCDIDDPCSTGIQQGGGMV